MREAEFTDQDRVELLESLAFEDEPRNRYGIPIVEATDPRYRYDWEMGLPDTDFVSEKAGKVQDRYKKDYPDADLDNLLWSVRRRTEDE